MQRLVTGCRAAAAKPVLRNGSWQTKHPDNYCTCGRIKKRAERNAEAGENHCTIASCLYHRLMPVPSPHACTIASCLYHRLMPVPSPLPVPSPRAYHRLVTVASRLMPAPSPHACTIASCLYHRLHACTIASCLYHRLVTVASRLMPADHRLVTVASRLMPAPSPRDCGLSPHAYTIAS
ncbi:hypothetical protein V5799_027148 [Amblyomma americanum]|uniref:Uncharacterized protein n=1 Tax=Amblyomma americanum TaxID=6943 RepID=A0AAQ4DGJ5_AMBAM